MSPSSPREHEDYKWTPYDRLDPEAKEFLDDMIDWLVNDSKRSIPLAEGLKHLTTEQRKAVVIELYDWGLLRLKVLAEDQQDITVGFELRKPDGTWMAV